VFNIGTGQSIKIISLIDMLSQLLGKKGIDYTFAPKRKGDINISLASIDKAKRLLNYNPRVSLEYGLKFLVNWIKENN
jgi:nucleoside-diphosphate-sugar epimerase